MDDPTRITLLLLTTRFILINSQYLAYYAYYLVILKRQWNFAKCIVYSVTYRTLTTTCLIFRWRRLEHLPPPLRLVVLTYFHVSKCSIREELTTHWFHVPHIFSFHVSNRKTIGARNPRPSDRKSRYIPLGQHVQHLRTYLSGCRYT